MSSLLCKDFLLLMSGLIFILFAAMGLFLGGIEDAVNEE